MGDGRHRAVQRDRGPRAPHRAWLARAPCVPMAVGGHPRGRWTTASSRVDHGSGLR
ncbi:hypothetical protein BVI1335_380010 [Burkholderia vietnamiensis]|nr:hypothetical protein BVI1335_380010 [Burkholderia vietnamiensis]